MSDKTAKDIVQEVQKDPEYQVFIKLVGEGKIPENWEDMADAIGVHRNTISRWKKMPEFQKALLAGIDESIKQMTHVGKKDWRMWRERYAMLMKEKKGDSIAVQVNMPTFNVMSEEAKKQLEELYAGSDRKDD